MQPCEQTRKLQTKIFGRKYEGATLSKLRGPADESIGRLAAWIKEPKGFLVIVGPSGTGKTYLCSAILENIPCSFRFVRGYTEDKLLSRIRESFNAGSSGDYSARVESLLDDDLIILDDVGSTGYTEWREEILFHAVNFRYSHQKPTIITSNLNEKDFYKLYNPRLVTRIFSKEHTILDWSHYPNLREEGL